MPRFKTVGAKKLSATSASRAKPSLSNGFLRRDIRMFSRTITPGESGITLPSRRRRRLRAGAAHFRRGISIVLGMNLRLALPDFVRQHAPARVRQARLAPIGRRRRRLDSKSHFRTPAVRPRFVPSQEVVRAGGERLLLPARL